MKRADPIPEFGAYLRELRESQRNPRLRSQEAVADWLTDNGVPIDDSSLSRYEHGRPQIDAAALWMLGELYGLTPETLLRQFMAARLKRSGAAPVVSVAPDEFRLSTEEYKMVLRFRELPPHRARLVRSYLYKEQATPSSEGRTRPRRAIAAPLKKARGSR